MLLLLQRTAHRLILCLSGRRKAAKECTAGLLAKKNKDVYVWIRIKDTNINYPIVQNEEDGYYLTHDYEKEKNRYGAIYSEKINAKDFNNEKTVLYGHDMADQSMFGGLKKFLNPKYRREHPYIEIDTPKEKRIYRIEAAYLCSDRHLLKNEEENREHGRGGECESGRAD